ncbi:TonB-dependent receptor [bacterium]|nr:TonB-dependent receptor [bacterium]
MNCTNALTGSRQDRSDRRIFVRGESTGVVRSELHSRSRAKLGLSLRALLTVMLLIQMIGLMIIFVFETEASSNGSIIGTIRDHEGKPLRNVQVKVSGTGFPGYRADQTRYNGRYHLVLLPPGTYMVEAELSGMKTLIMQNITVSMNETEYLNLTMEVSGNPEEVELVIITPRVEPLSQDGRLTVPSEFIKRLPNSTYTRQVISMGGGTIDGKSGFFSGSTHADNLYIIDGIDATDPVTHLFRIDLNTDALDQIQVQTGGYSAEYGRAMGGVVDAVTRNGGDTFEGTVRLRYTSDSWQADPQHSEATTEQADYFEPMLAFGGPLVQDNLWFFLNYQQHRLSQNYGTCDFMNNAEGNVPKTQYLSDSLCQLLGTKLSLSLGSHFDAELIYSGNEGELDRLLDERYSPEAQSRWNMSEQIYGLTMKLIPSSTFYVTGMVGAYRTMVESGPVEESDEMSVYDPDLDRWYGNFPYHDQTDRARTSYSLTLNQIKDDWRGFQRFTLGIEHQILEEQRDHTYTNGMYYEIGGYGSENEQPLRRFSFGDSEIATDTCEYWAVYILESWEMYKNFTLTPSFRWESSRFKNQDDHVVHLFDRMFAPRISFAWDLTKTGKTQLYGSVGRYYNPYDLTLISMDPGSSHDIEVWLYGPDHPDADAEGYYYNKTMSSSAGNLIDPDIKPESSDEYVLGFDIEITPHWATGIRYQYKHTRDLIEDVGFWEDENGDLHLATDVDTSDQAAVQDWYDHWQDRRYIATNPADAYRDYSASEIHSTVRTNRLWLELSYTYSEYRGTHMALMTGDQFKNYQNHFTPYYDTPLLSQNLDGPLSYDMPHNLKAYAVYQLPWQVSLGTRLHYQSGYVYNKLGNYGPGTDGVYGSADDVDHRDPAYGAGITLPEGRGTYRLPDVFLADLSVQKDFDLEKWGMITAILDVTNLLDNQVTIRRTETEGSDFGTDQEWLSPRLFSVQLKYSF